MSIRVDTGGTYLLGQTRVPTGPALEIATVLSTVAGKAERTQPPTNYAGTALVLDVTHAESYIRTTSAVPVTITIPLNFTNLLVGRYVSGIQVGAGRVAFVKGDPSIIINCSATLYTRAAGSPWTLYKAGANEYDLSGDLLL